MSDFDYLIRLLQDHGLTVVGTSIIWLYLAIQIYKEPEKFGKWISYINLLFSWVNLTYEKRGVAGDIEADIRKTTRVINSQVPGEILPYGIELKWSAGEKREVFVKDKKVVIRMKHHRNQSKNFMYATLGYTEFGLIPNKRDLIDETITRAMELIFTKKIFNDAKKYDAIQIFNDVIVKPEIQDNSNLERYCDIFDGLEEKGQFTRIALREFSIIGDNLSGDIQRNEILKDTIKFTNMLERLATKKTGIDVSPVYNGTVIKCSIVLIAKPETYIQRGLKPYIDFVNSNIEDGFMHFYFSAFSPLNIIIAKRLADAFAESNDLDIISNEEFIIRENLEAIIIMLVRK